MSHWTSRSQQQTGRVHSHQYSGRSRAPRPDEAAVGRLEAALDQMERRQALAVSQMQDRYENKARAIRSALAQLGLKSGAAAPASGGPFVPVKLASEDQAFGRALLRVNLARADASAL